LDDSPSELLLDAIFLTRVSGELEGVGEEDISVGCVVCPRLAGDPESTLPFGEAVLIEVLDSREALGFRVSLGI